MNIGKSHNSVVDVIWLENNCPVHQLVLVQASHGTSQQAFCFVRAMTAVQPPVNATEHRNSAAADHPILPSTQPSPAQRAGFSHPHPSRTPARHCRNNTRGLPAGSHSKTAGNQDRRKLTVVCSESRAPHPAGRAADKPACWLGCPGGRCDRRAKPPAQSDKGVT